MQVVSQAYRQSMEQTTREGFYMDVTIGVINQAAQDKAFVLPEVCTEWSNLTKPFQNYDVEYTYATMEQDFFRVDGQMLFLPEEGPYFNSGLIAGNTLAAITIRFADGPYDIKGLMVDFGLAYPIDFMIESDASTVTITNNLDGHFVTEEIFNKVTYITFRPLRMIGGQQRIRIEKIQMGLGIYFSNRQITNAIKKDFISLISEELPSSDLSVTIGNKDRKFDVENSSSTINYLEIGQECWLRYGKLLANGNIEQLDGALLYLDSWKADDRTMTFGAKDSISDLNNTYYRGIKRKTNLYDLALDVLTDAGVDPRTYEIDPYLHNIYVTNPMPVVTHKEALQIIANAGRCILYQDRQGIIQIKAGFATIIAQERMEVRSDDTESYSDLQSVVLPSAKYDYARMYQDYFRVDGSVYFLPESGSPLTTGFVSHQLADKGGSFAKNPRLTIELEAAFQFFGVDIEFAGNPPAEFTIHTFRNHELQESHAVTVTGIKMSISYPFREFDTMEFEFTKGRSNNPVIVQYVKFGDVSDYKFTYRSMTETPMGEQVEKYKDIQVQMLRYSESQERKELFKDTIQAGGIYTVYLSNAGYGFTVSRGIITSCSAYSVTVDMQGISGEVELIINGYEYIQAASTYTLQLNTTGGSKNWGNPLVSEADHAALLAEWIGNYLNNNVEYEIAYRGDFCLDAGDITFLENKYIDKLQIAVTEHTISFDSGALKGAVKARRAQNGVDTTQNQLARRFA
mgnify:FL=1